MPKTEIDLRKLYVYLLYGLLSPLTDCDPKIATVPDPTGKQQTALTVKMSPAELFGIPENDDLVYCERYREIMGLTIVNHDYICENTEESYPLFVDCRFDAQRNRSSFVLSERAAKEKLLMAMLEML